MSLWGAEAMVFWIGLIILLVIFTAVFKITSEKNQPLLSDITTCPDCQDGKILDQTHNSIDIEVVNCPRCRGTGEISIKNHENFK